MTEESSSDDSSIYQDFATPSQHRDELYKASGEYETEQDSEELDWDTHQETPSYIEKPVHKDRAESTPVQPHPRHPYLPWTFCENPDPADPYSVWLPWRLLSDINNKLIVNLVPRPETLRFDEETLEN